MLDRLEVQGPWGGRVIFLQAALRCFIGDYPYQVDRVSCMKITLRYRARWYGYKGAAGAGRRGQPLRGHPVHGAELGGEWPARPGP